jgi:hypothetical protein
MGNVSSTPPDQVSLLPLTEPSDSNSNNKNESQPLYHGLEDQAPREARSHTWAESKSVAIDGKIPPSSSKAEENHAYGHFVDHEKQDASTSEFGLKRNWEPWSYVPWRNRPHPLPGRTASPPSPSFITRTRRYTQLLAWRTLRATIHTITGEYPVPDDAVLRNTRLFFSLCEASCQIDCIRVARIYQTCRAPDLAPECTLLKAARPPLDLYFLSNPSTTVFVFTCLAYSLFASTQFSFNKVDRFQRLFLMVGLVVAFCMSLPSEIGEGRISAWRFRMYVTGALGVSTCGHWVWWMGLGKREVEKVESSDGEKVEKRMIEEV